MTKIWKIGIRPWCKTIQEAATDVWELRYLFLYQLSIIDRLISDNTPADRRNILCVNTSGGKSPVILITAIILRRIHLVIVPLLALGGNQVGNC